MEKKMYKSIRFIAVLSLLFVFTLSVTWAAVNYYSASRRLKKGKKAIFAVVRNGRDKIRIKIRKGALDDYLIEEGIKSVKVTADLEEEWVDDGDGEGYYRLKFTFGPTGAYFDPPLELELQGGYFSEDAEVKMYDEEGEEIESDVHQGRKKITFYIPHFSVYSYDDYDYSN